MARTTTPPAEPVEETSPLVEPVEETSPLVDEPLPTAFRNVSPLGDLEVPALGRVVAAGEVVEVTADQAVGLVGQAGTWEPTDPPHTEES